MWSEKVAGVLARGLNVGLAGGLPRFVVAGHAGVDAQVLALAEVSICEFLDGFEPSSCVLGVGASTWLHKGASKREVCNKHSTVHIDLMALEK